MDRSSYFIENLALFGPFPEQEWIEELESNGVTHFINLTYPNENLTTPYRVSDSSTVIRYSIRDKDIPKDKQDFCNFIIDTINLLHSLQHKKQKLYIHCKGGHGRSGMIVACLLIQWFRIKNPNQAIQLTTEYRNARLILKDKYLKQSSPHMDKQKEFVRSIGAEILISKDHSLYSNFIPILSCSEILIEDKQLLNQYYTNIYDSIIELVQSNKDLENFLSRPNIGTIILYKQENSEGREDGTVRVGELINLALNKIKNIYVHKK